jgi:hypothetical protein
LRMAGYTKYLKMKLPKFNIERCSLIFIEIIIWFTAGHYRHGVRFIENRHEIDEKVKTSNNKGDNFKVENGGIYKIFEDDHLQLASYTIYSH